MARLGPGQDVVRPVRPATPRVPLARGAGGRPIPDSLRDTMETAFAGRAIGGAAAPGRVSRPDDAGEHEAHAVARDVSRRVSSPGRPVGPRPGLPDFSTVRLHTGPAASSAALAIGASAFTVGEDVVLGGSWTGSGERQRTLLAHELTHVLQQRAGGTGVQRQALPGTAAPAALQLPPGDNLEASRAVMRAIDGLTATADGSFTTTYQGQTLHLTPEQAEHARTTARRAVAEVLAKATRRLDLAMGRYRAQKSVDKDQWFASSAVHAYAWARTLGSHQDPGMMLTLQGQAVSMSDLEARRAMSEGRLVAAAESAARGEVASGRAAEMVRVYIDQTIEGGESLATGLEYTRDAAFITLGALAVVATGGAAAGLAPGVVGTGIGGLTVGGTATVISVGAPIVASLGVGLAKTVAGDPVDWGAIAVDAAVQVVLAKFGGKLGEGIFGRLAGNEVARTVARRAVASVLSGVATHEVGQAFTVTAHGVFNALRGRPVTWGQYVDELAARLSDPKGIFIAAAMSGFQLAAHSKIDKAAASQRSQGPTAKPVGEKPVAPKEPVVEKPVVPKEPVTEASMAATRRRQNIESLADVPELQGAVATAAPTKGVGNLADIPPEVLRPAWAAYQKNSAARVAEGKQPLEFSAYLKATQASEGKASFGEMTDTFGRAKTEIVVQPPGRVNEKGIDSVSYAPGPGGGRVKLLDNKAYAKNVGKVSALQENLPQNLRESTALLRDAATSPNAPPELAGVVLPRMEAASKAVDAHVDAWSKANPGKPLTDRKLQTDLGKILDQHGIDRVVTTEAGKAGVGITSTLGKQGFAHE